MALTCSPALWANADDPTYGRLRVDGTVQRLGDVVAHDGEPLEPALGEALVTELELQVGDDRREVGVPRALAEAVQRALHVTRAGAHRGHRVGDRAAGVVVAVDADHHVAADMAVHVGDDRLDLVRQRPTVGVAQHDVGGALDHRRLERPHRELRGALVAVEEVLHVDEHAAAVGRQVLDRVGDHRLALVERRLERLGHVILGALGDDADGLGAGLDQVAQRRVVVDLALRPAGRAERDERAGGQRQLVAGAGEELDVLRVGARPAALDVAHAQQVELLGDPQLVLDAGRDAFDLQAVAQRRVEDLYRIHWLLTWFLTSS